jgi:NAD(P)-dependent dehydrogenase (short-subunit alcohol dehydrogenase family)
LYAPSKGKQEATFMSKKRILITGAGSGFGEGTAIGLAQNGHDVIAGAQIWPQVTSLRQKVKALGLNNLRVEKLDLLDPYDVANALKWDIDILFNNAAIGENGPICEIPLDLVRRTFEINVFAPLELAQKFIRNWVDQKRPGKVVFTSSVAGLITAGTVLAPYTASKHALQCIAESLQQELKPFQIQVQTINPGAFLTGFNETMCESAFQWQDDSSNFIKRADIQNYFAFFGEEDLRRDPKEVIEAMVSIVPADTGLFRNVVPKADEEFIKTNQREAWGNKI